MADSPTQKPESEDIPRSATHFGWKVLWLVMAAVLGAAATLAVTYLTTRESDLTATVRFGRVVTAEGAESGYYDVHVANDGKKMAAGVWIDVPSASKAMISRAGKTNEWRDVVRNRIELADIPSRDSVDIYTLIPDAPSEGTAEGVKIGQRSEGSAGTVVMAPTKPKPSLSLGGGILVGLVVALLVILTHIMPLLLPAERSRIRKMDWYARQMIGSQESLVSMLDETRKEYLAAMQRIHQLEAEVARLEGRTTPPND